MSQQLIIGLGSGRSGSVSLARFLDAQPDSYFVHEGAYGSRRKYAYGHLLPWKVNPYEFTAWDIGLRRAAGGARFYGDIASYFLPYVPHILERYPDARFICLKRDRAAVVRSFMTKTSGVNHFMEHDGTHWLHDRWDAIFPKMPAKEKHEAIGAYWDLYYREAEKYQQAYPLQFKIFPLEALNTPEGRGGILDFAGFPKEGRRIEGEFHSNRSIPVVTQLARLATALFTPSIRRN